MPQRFTNKQQNKLARLLLIELLFQPPLLYLLLFLLPCYCHCHCYCHWGFCKPYPAFPIANDFTRLRAAHASSMSPLQHQWDHIVPILVRLKYALQCKENEPCSLNKFESLQRSAASSDAAIAAALYALSSMPYCKWLNQIASNTCDIGVSAIFLVE